MTTELGRAASVAPSLHHVALGTSSVETLSRFYCQLLNTTELRRHLDAAGELRSVWIDLASSMLMIERADPEAEPRHVRSVGLGPFLLAFRVSTGERSQFEARAAGLGHPVETRSEFTSYLRDPDGNRVAFSEYEPAP